VASPPPCSVSQRIIIKLLLLPSYSLITSDLPSVNTDHVTQVFKAPS
jgi:hypothetical protein